VDFPGFNLLAARLLRRKFPEIRLVYLSPPQLWVWGEWRVKFLKDLFDDILVINSFESSWLFARGLSASYVGSRVLDSVRDFYKKSFSLNYDKLILESTDKLLSLKEEKTIIFAPGSRAAELSRNFKLFVGLAKLICSNFKSIKIFWLVADSVDKSLILEKLIDAEIADRVQIVSNPSDRYFAMVKATFAVAKPGTITQELAFFIVKTLVLLRPTFLDFLVGKLLISGDSLSLPNIALSPGKISTELVSPLISPERAFSFFKMEFGKNSFDENFLRMSRAFISPYLKSHFDLSEI
jgi:lipid-A-disaccharide synthase